MGLRNMKIRWVRVYYENKKYEKILAYTRWLAASTTQWDQVRDLVEKYQIKQTPIVELITNGTLIMSYTTSREKKYEKLVNSVKGSFKKSPIYLKQS
jgi:hypothetical protein